MMQRLVDYKLIALPVLILASCGGDEGAGGEAAEAEEIRADLAAVGGSAAEGIVRLSLAEGTYTAVVAIDTHRGPGDYAVHIHGGSCSEGGSVTVPLTSVEGGEGGEGQSRTTFPAADLPESGSYFVQLHDAQDRSPIACADLPAM